MEIRNGKEAKKIKAKLEQQYEQGSLKDGTMKKFLRNYYNGDPTGIGFSGKKDDLLTEYMHVHLSMIDDEGNVRDFEEPYYRDKKLHCCGRVMEPLEGINYCTVCGIEKE